MTPDGVTVAESGPKITVATNSAPGCADNDRKLAEAKTKKEALRCLKRRIPDVIYRHLLADAERH